MLPNPSKTRPAKLGFCGAINFSDNKVIIQSIKVAGIGTQISDRAIHKNNSHRNKHKKSDFRKFWGFY